MKPQLRFKRNMGGYYEEYPDWQEKKLDKNTYIKGRVGWKNLKAEEYVDDGIPMIAGKHITSGKIDWKSVDHIPAERYEESPEIALKNGDVIFSKDGSLGNPAFIDNLSQEATINGTMMLIRLSEKIDKVNSHFFYYILQTKKFEKLIRTIKSGGTVPHIFQRDIINFKFNITSIEEQRKIACFLSKIDERIELEEKKLELFKERKRGWMQKIFSQEIRFKDENGNNYPDWEEKKLGEVLTFKAGKKINICEHGKFVVINMGSLSSEGNIISKLYSNEVDSLLYQGDLFMPKDDIGGGNIIGKLGYIDKDEFYVLSDHVYKVTCDECSLFYKYLFLSEGMRRSIKRIVTGSAQLGLSDKNVKQIVTIIPSLPEQEKIADFLSKQDELISAQGRKVSLLKEQKRGLLQQMFV